MFGSGLRASRNDRPVTNHTYKATMIGFMKTRLSLLWNSIVQGFGSLNFIKIHCKYLVYLFFFYFFFMIYFGNEFEAVLKILIQAFELVLNFGRPHSFYQFGKFN